MRRRLLTLISLLASLAVAGTVYKWVDENGVVHYSDQPHPEAQKVDVPPAQTYKGGASVPAMPTTGTSAPPASSEPASAYQGCAISEPAKDQTFTNVDALSVMVRTDPGPPRATGGAWPLRASPRRRSRTSIPRICSMR